MTAYLLQLRCDQPAQAGEPAIAEGMVRVDVVAFRWDEPTSATAFHAPEGLMEAALESPEGAERLCAWIARALLQGNLDLPPGPPWLAPDRASAASFLYEMDVDVQFAARKGGSDEVCVVECLHDGQRIMVGWPWQRNPDDLARRGLVLAAAAVLELALAAGRDQDRANNRL